MNLSERHLFETHSAAEIARWCAGLKRFRFCRARGGFAGDGDSLKASIEFADEAELTHVMHSLGVTLNLLSPDDPKPVPGKAYTGQEWKQFKTAVAEFPRYEQPGWEQIAGVPAFVWVGARRVDIDLSGAGGDLYAVTERDYENALKVEGRIGSLALRFVHPPRGCQCLCPECHPSARGTD